MASKDLAKRLLTEVEGESSEVYQDSKNIPTVGKGISLRSAASQDVLKSLGYNPEKVKRGQKSVKAKDLAKAEDMILSQKEKLLDNMQSSSFPDAKLNDAQRAALLSLAYNSPKLIGSNLRESLNKGDEIEAMKEIALRSNKDKMPGVTYRRLREAEMFGGPLGFQQMIDSMSEEEKNLINNSLRDAQDPQRKQMFLDKYPQFSPAYEEPIQKRFNNLFKVGK